MLLKEITHVLAMPAPEVTFTFFLSFLGMERLFPCSY